jgi:hypothetical protein
MKRRVVTLGLLIVIAIFSSGCTSIFQNSGSAITSTSNGGQVSPTVITSLQPIQQLAPPTDIQKDNKYVIGDIIARTPNEGTSAKIVYGYNSETKKYQFDTIYTNQNNQWGYRIYPNLESEELKWVEEYYPYLIDHIEIASIVTQYSSKSASDSALNPTHTITPTKTQDDSSYTTTSSEGECPVGQCWVNGYYRKTGVYVHGYCRRC